MQQQTGVVQFVVIDNGVDRDLDLRSKLMGIMAKRTDVVNTVACCRPGTETRCTNINGIGTMVNGRDATFQILRRSQ